MYDLYESNANDSARFLLGKKGSKPILIIGLNPSTANQVQSDVTVAKVETVSLNNGYNGFVMANLYPVRSTNPRNLPERCDESLFNANIEYIIKVIKKYKTCNIWAAWGGSISKRNYLRDSCIELAKRTKKYSVQWLNYGRKTKKGHPPHPSRLSYSWSFEKFDIEEHCTNI